jgi:hypothetical protein
LDIQTVKPFGERLSSGFVLANQDISWRGFQLRLRATPCV